MKGVPDESEIYKKDFDPEPYFEPDDTIEDKVVYCMLVRHIPFTSEVVRRSRLPSYPTLNHKLIATDSGRKLFSRGLASQFALCV